MYLGYSITIMAMAKAQSSFSGNQLNVAAAAHLISAASWHPQAENKVTHLQIS